MEKVTYTRMLGTQPGIKISCYHFYFIIFTGPGTTQKSAASSSGAAVKAKEEEESIKQILSKRLR